MKKKSFAVVIISNGPGELTTWVKPVINQLKKLINSSNSNYNISLRLSLVPCPNATGRELQVANNWDEFDLITAAASFWKLLLKPSKFSNWPKKGIVVFLGGDQFWSVLLAKRLGYKSITYAEWIARWPRWNNYIVAMNNQVKEKLSRKHQSKCFVIGDLMADIKNHSSSSIRLRDQKWLAILPGSKKTKLSIGIPYFLQMADCISKEDSNLKILIPIAPTTNLDDYLYFQSHKNPITKFYSSGIKTIRKIDNSAFDYIIETNKKTKIYIISTHPNYEILSQCKLAVTTVGANTAELASINLPMIVVLPTQHLGYMKAWDGIIGIFAKVSFINRLIISLLKTWYLKNKKYFAWPNIKAKKIIVPERIGNFSPEEIAKEVLILLNDEQALKDQRNNLSKQRGKEGAAKKLAEIIFRTVILK
tara:strand:+ start:2317 stop:3576 length:1260 start_codon:yes stop_codon:yes gene_type:complete